MVLECLGSSSAGNCYLLRAAHETLIVECGIEMRKVKRALDWSLRDVVACVVSHEHKDHAGHIKDFMKYGIKVLASNHVFGSQRLQGNPFATQIETMKRYRAGGFTIFPFPVVHDVPCMGFVIAHPEMGKTLFVTDCASLIDRQTMQLKYEFTGLNHIMIEANYSDEILSYNIENGITPASLRKRLEESHMEIRDTADALRCYDLSAVNEIVLLHLSGDNSNMTAFRETIEQVSGLPVRIASDALKIEFSQDPY